MNLTSKRKKKIIHAIRSNVMLQVWRKCNLNLSPEERLFEEYVMRQIQLVSFQPLTNTSSTTKADRDAASVIQNCRALSTALLCCP